MSTHIVPIALPSVANLREHWATKAKRAKAQRSAVLLALPARKLAAERNWLAINGKVVVHLVRAAPRRLDSDNLARAFKAVRDQVAAQLGLASDADPRVAWLYEQERGLLLGTVVCVELECVPADTTTMQVPF